MKLDELLKATTPGPAFVEPHQDNRVKTTDGTLAVVCQPLPRYAAHGTRDEALLLAHARNVLPQLVKALEVIEHDLAELQGSGPEWIKASLRSIQGDALAALQLAREVKGVER